MRSYTSSSRTRRRFAVRHLGWFLATVLGSILAVDLAWKLTPLRGSFVLDAAALPRPSPDHYLSVTDQNIVDAHVFAHGLENVCAFVQAADVLFFGDSRLQFAFDAEELRSFFAERGLRSYLLGVPRGTDVLAHRILERCDAHSRLVIVFETGFFTGERTHYDEIALDSSRFEAEKFQFEFEMAFLVRRNLHRVLPHPVGRDRWGAGRILYRSRVDGSWWVAAGNELSLPVQAGVGAKIEIPTAHLRAAERFRAEVERRGGDLVIAYVGAGNARGDRAYTIAEHLGVPLVDPQITGLQTADGLHLRADSARRYGEAFLRELDPLLP